MKNNEKMWICSCETWNLTSLTMKGRASQIGFRVKLALTPKPLQNFKCAWCESKNMRKMMLKREWLWNLFEMLFRSWFTLLSINYTTKGGRTQVITSKRKTSYTKFNWAWKGSKLELLNFWHVSPPIKINNYLIKI